MDRAFHTELDVPVAGGTLRVAVAGAPISGDTPGPPGSGAPIVLAVHGITGSHRSWLAVARHLGQDVTLLAPDLRGRGGSSDLPEPYGLAQHIEDLVAVLDHAGATEVVLAGHSMGAYVVARLAAAHPARTAGVALVDGGMPIPAPKDVDPDEILATVLGPALARLRMTFPDEHAYRDFWREHPAFAGPGVWNDEIEDYVDYDLRPADPATGERRSRVSEEAVRADGADLLDTEAVRRYLLGLAGPVVVLRATRGMLNEPRPFVSAEAVSELTRDLPQLVDVEVPDTNHYLVLMGDREAAVVAERIAALAGVNQGLAASS
jgi:pimeloyl-ACP methyl ester carboxylesterase